MNIQIRDATWKASGLLGLHFGIAGSLVNIVGETKRMPFGNLGARLGCKTGLFSSKEEYEPLTDKLAEEWDSWKPLSYVLVNRPDSEVFLFCTRIVEASVPRR